MASILLVGGFAACGDDGDATTTTTTEAPTTTNTTTESSTTTTTEATTATVEAVVARIQGSWDDDFVQSTPPPGVIGPSQIACSDTGPIEVGGVFACESQPQTEPGVDLDRPGVVFYVLDASGRAAVDVATDIPNSTERLMAEYEQAPKGLFCRDLLDPDVDAYPIWEFYPFAQGSTPARNFFWSLVYWSLEGEPDRMDEDGNGIPCETLFEPEVIARVLDGGEIQ